MTEGSPMQMWGAGPAAHAPQLAQTCCTCERGPIELRGIIHILHTGRTCDLFCGLRVSFPDMRDDFKSCSR